MKEAVNIKDILSDSNKKITEAENILSRLFRTMLYDLSIGNRIFDNLVKRYLYDPNSGIKDDPTSRNNHRGNLMKELAAADMTWRVFMKALRVIGVEEFEIVVNVKRKDTGKTSHVVYAENTLAYEEQVVDLSKAKVIEHFVSESLMNKEESHVPSKVPYISDNVADKFVIPKVNNETSQG